MNPSLNGFLFLVIVSKKKITLFFQLKITLLLVKFCLFFDDVDILIFSRSIHMLRLFTNWLTDFNKYHFKTTFIIFLETNPQNNEFILLFVSFTKVGALWKETVIVRWIWLWWISHFSLENGWILRKSSPNTDCSASALSHCERDMVCNFQTYHKKLSHLMDYCSQSHTLLPANSYLLRFNTSMLLLYCSYRARTVFEASNSDIKLFRNQRHRVYL